MPKKPYLVIGICQLEKEPFGSTLGFVSKIKWTNECFETIAIHERYSMSHPRRRDCITVYGVMEFDQDDFNPAASPLETRKHILKSPVKQNEIKEIQWLQWQMFTKEDVVKNQKPDAMGVNRIASEELEIIKQEMADKKIKFVNEILTIASASKYWEEKNSRRPAALSEINEQFGLQQFNDLGKCEKVLSAIITEIRSRPKTDSGRLPLTQSLYDAILSENYLKVSEIFAEVNKFKPKKSIFSTWFDWGEKPKNESKIEPDPRASDEFQSRSDKKL